LGHHMTSRHSGELLHKCTIGECTEAFTEASILKNHLRVFHKVMPHHCSTCGEMFDKRMELNRHKEHCKMTSLAVEKWLTESPLMVEHVDEPTDGNTVNDNMESIADDLFEEEIEKEKESRPKSEKRVENIALSTSHQCLVCSKIFKSQVWTTILQVCTTKKGLTRSENFLVIYARSLLVHWVVWRSICAFIPANALTSVLSMNAL
ncbi:hypothetical protein PENTCL1PPCAC_12483, partial [Pristionchus entomophagus]